MEPEDDKKVDEFDNNPVVDYYKKYSQNRELPKYFSGTTIPYISGEINLPDPQKQPLTETKSPVKIEIHTDTEDDRNLSPSSSVTSNRKLEWDNGADIGYGNYNTKFNIQKSSSLPVLSDLGEYKPSTKGFISDLKQSQKTHENVKIIPIVYDGSSKSDQSATTISEKNKSERHSGSSSDSKIYTEGPNVIPSSSSTSYATKISKTAPSSSSSNFLVTAKNTSLNSDSSSDKEKYSKFASTLAYLKQKIGSPDAESTPNVDVYKSESDVPCTPEYTETPIVTKPKKFPRKLNESKKDNANSCESEEGEINKNKTDSKKIGPGKCTITYKSKQSLNKIVKLCRTKPLTIECIDLKKKRSENKEIQASEKVSVYCQTSEIETENDIIIIANPDNYVENQSVICVAHSSGEDGSKTFSSQTQTDSGNFVSNCNSFEYLYGEEYEPNKREPQKTNDVEPVAVSSCSNLKRSRRKSDLTNVSSSSTNKTDSKSSSNTNFPLGNVINDQQRTDIILDINKSVTLLQKLILSKKYDKATKRYYIKKLIEKMSMSKYLGDSSSTSSELFYPKKSYAGNDLPKNTNINSSGEDHPESLIKHSCLKNNVPWFPASTNKKDNVIFEKPSKRVKKLQIKTYNDEILPEIHNKTEFMKKQTETNSSTTSKQRVIPTESSDEIRQHRHLQFTLTNNEFQINREQLPITTTSSEDYMRKHSRFTLTNTDLPINQAKSSGNSSNDLFFSPKQYSENSLENNQFDKNDVCSSGSSKNNWRDDKTLSERLLEKGSSVAQGDHLLSYAKSERKFQLSWINNEISHLHKLRKLLETRPKDKVLKEAIASVYKEAHVEDMGGIQKTTTVYMVSQKEKNSPTSSYSSCKNSRRSSKQGTNFVIHTELPVCSRAGNVNFNLIDDRGKRKYICKEVNKDIPNKPSNEDCSNIHVTKKDDTTNIVVNCNKPCGLCSTIPCCCSKFASKEPILVGGPVYQSSNFPTSKSEHRCVCPLASTCSCHNKEVTKTDIRCIIEIPDLRNNVDHCSCPETDTKSTSSTGLSFPTWTFPSDSTKSKEIGSQAGSNFKEKGVQSEHIIQVLDHLDGISTRTDKQSKDQQSESNSVKKGEQSDKQCECNSVDEAVQSDVRCECGCNCLIKEEQSDKQCYCKCNCTQKAVQCGCKCTCAEEAVQCCCKCNCAVEAVESGCYCAEEAVQCGCRCNCAVQSDMQRECACTCISTGMQSNCKCCKYATKKSGQRKKIRQVGTAITKFDRCKSCRVIGTSTTNPNLGVNNRQIGTFTTNTDQDKNFRQIGTAVTKSDQGIDNRQVGTVTTKSDQGIDFRQIGTATTNSDQYKSCQIGTDVTKTDQGINCCQICTVSTYTDQDKNSRQIGTATLNCDECKSCRQIGTCTTSSFQNKNSQIGTAKTSSDEGTNFRQIDTYSKNTNEDKNYRQSSTGTIKTNSVQNKNSQIGTAKTSSDGGTNFRQIDTYSKNTNEDKNYRQSSTGTIKTDQDINCRQIGTTTMCDQCKDCRVVGTATLNTDQDATTNTSKDNTSRQIGTVTTKSDQSINSRQIGTITRKSDQSINYRHTSTGTIKTDQGIDYRQIGTGTKECGQCKICRLVGPATMNIDQNATTNTDQRKSSQQVGTVTTKSDQGIHSRPVSTATINTDQDAATNTDQQKRSQKIGTVTTKSDQSMNNRQIGSVTRRSDQSINYRQSSTGTTKTDQITCRQIGTTTMCDQCKDCRIVGTATMNTDQEATTNTNQDKTTQQIGSVTTKSDQSINYRQSSTGTIKTDQDATTNTDQRKSSQQIGTVTTKSDQGIYSRPVGTATINTDQDAITNTDQDKTSQQIGTVTTKSGQGINYRPIGTATINTDQDAITNTELDKSSQKIGTVTTKSEQCDKCCQIGTQANTGDNRSIETVSSTPLSSSTESSESFIECVCCKQKRISKLANLREKLDQNFPLCFTCNTQRQTLPYHQYSPYINPNHICNCYSVVPTTTLNEIKRTVNELNCLDESEEYCTCNKSKKDKNNKYCKRCNCKLKSPEKNKNGVAYMLTFDFEEKPKKEKTHHKKRELEEIKIKIPYPPRKKKLKDRENIRIQGTEEQTSENSNSTPTNGNSKLMDYLIQNRPNFIQNAEERRKAIVQCNSERQENSELKKLLLLKEFDSNVKITGKKINRYFTSKQMKEINKRNYKKLPEVQQKLIDNRERQIRDANRLIVDQFNQKLRASVLKGKSSLPLDLKVVNLVCTK